MTDTHMSISNPRLQKKKINAAKGDSLALDDVILEFA